MLQCVDVVVGAKGEGVVLRLPQSKYEHGRSLCLLKIKVCFGID